MSKKITTEDFIENLKKIQPNLKVVGVYTKAVNPILVQDNYGTCLIRPIHLLGGRVPTIQCAVNKTEYFLNVLKEKNLDFYNNFTLIEEYVLGKKQLLFQNKNGVFKIWINQLYTDWGIGIGSAIDKSKYFANQAKEVHNEDLYDYSLVEWKDSNSNIKIICKKENHGVFEQRPSHHLSGHGCPKCMVSNNRENPPGWSLNSWKKSAKKSKHFDGFKVYIVKCCNKSETFYKIGRTYTTTKFRFRGKVNMPYNYQVVKEIEADADYIFKLETQLKKEHKDFAYVPKKEFGGRYECFSQVNLNNIYRTLL